jgi:thiol-disulfide isomerase/thioredoxin
MRIKTLRQGFSLVGLIIAAAWTGLVSSPAEPAAQTNSHALTLKGSDADAAWAEIEKSTRPPPGPATWRDTPPSAAEKQKFYLPFIQALADKGKDFYTTYPKDSHAIPAKLLEFKFLFLTVMYGETKQQARLDAVEKSLLNDAAISEDDRIGVLREVAQASAPDKARPLLQGIANGDAPAKLKTAAAEYLDKMKALGQPVNLQFTAVDGRSVNLAKLKGKVVLIDFWATWCGPCVGEVPNVKKIYDQYHGKGFEIVSISLDKDKDSLTHFIADKKMDWPQYFDGQGWQNKYARQFGIESIPTMWLIDKKGNLRDMNARADLSGGVQKLLAE